MQAPMSRARYVQENRKMRFEPLLNSEWVILRHVEYRDEELR